MRRVLITLALFAAMIAAARAQVWIMSPASQMSGKGHGAPPVLTNLRITNTGAFRITNTGDNRAVFP